MTSDCQFPKWFAIGCIVGCAIVAASAAQATRPVATGGYTHSYVLAQDGFVHAAGQNDYGELGNGTNTPSPSFVNVLPVNVHTIVQIASGLAHGLALRQDGTLWTWGYNEYGQLGNGTTTDSNVPVQVTAAGLANVVSIAAGRFSSYAIDGTGSVWAWGRNGSGALGDGTTTDRHSPVKLATIGGVVKLAPESYSVLALLADGTMRAWGENSFGQLGTGDTNPRNAPVPAQPALTNVVKIATGYNFAFALLADGTIRAWGSSQQAGYLLGNGSNLGSLVPVTVQTAAGTPLTCVAEIAGNGPGGGQATTCAGLVYVWGSPAASACLGTTSTTYPYATPISGVTGAAGVFGPLGTDNTHPATWIYRQGGTFRGELTVCGFNLSGQLGTGDTTMRSTPALLSVTPGAKTGRRTNFVPFHSLSDVFWRKTDGTNVIWEIYAGQPADYQVSVLPGVPSTWTAKGTGDVSGEATSDIVWFQPSTGQVAIWLMEDYSSIARVSFPASVGTGSSWQIQAVGDMDGDSRADLLWRNSSSGEVLVWFMRSDGTIDQALSYGNVPTSYQIRTLADVDGDWIKDIVWFQPSTGQVVIWKMHPTGSYTAWFPASVGAGSGWDIYKAGDFDADGREDLFWRRNTGTTAVWYMNGPNVAAAQFLDGVPIADWSMQAVGDYDGDGREDLLWLSTGGQVIRWKMQGRTSPAIVQPIVGIGTGWQSVQ